MGRYPGSNSRRSSQKKRRLGYSGRGPRPASFKNRFVGRRAGLHIGYNASGSKSRRACLMGRHPEKKFLDTALDETPNASTGSFQELVAIGQGATDSDRVGRKAIITDVLVKGHLQFAQTDGAAPLTENRMRVMIVQDTQPNGVLWTSAQLFASTDINSYKKLINAKRFKVHYDHTFTRGSSSGHGDGTANDTGPTFIPFNINIKCCIDMEYDEAVGTSGTIDEQTLNSLQLWCIEEAGTPNTLIHGQCRVRFVE